MHDSSWERMVAFVDTCLAPYRTAPLEIVDVGSQVVAEGTRSYRSLFEASAWRYRGLDIAPGRNVDVAVANPYRWDELAPDSVDVVISGQALEHIPFFWVTAFEIGRILRPGGLAMLIAPSRGPEHRFPVDCWRFYRDGMDALALYLGFELLDSDTDGGQGWGDSILVMRKPSWDDSLRTAFLRRRELQQCVLSGGELEEPEVLAAARPSVLAQCEPHQLSKRLDDLRTRPGWRGLIHRLAR